METLQTSENRTVEPIMLDNLILDSEAVRDADGKYFVKSQQGWEQYFAGTGKRLPTVAEYITIFKQLNERSDSAIEGIMQDLCENALCTGTKIDYRTSNLPVGGGYLNILMKDSTWWTELQDLLQHDVEEAINMLYEVSGKHLYIWTPDASGRKSRPERVVWLDVYADKFILNCSGSPFVIGGARGVRVVGAAGAQKKEGSPVEGSVYRKPAMTEEQRLEGQISEALSLFDQLKSPATPELYAKLKQQALQQLKKLYHG